ncbi:PLP-dependent aminotransferase family protein [Caballeronia sp. EK]|uniref:MocR-like ectoine utilization transcription factor EhuR n=1 Tax=Caballeronia sp. EK TaxID=2767469 RepID=UPI001654CEB1|nr:PLP-dependent aminotransferase family protein [Caballeronia sp. EK]MBC8641641.1 PLP-dependent aminotransferase family protein [Caballeronia sp. EK]
MKHLKNGGGWITAVREAAGGESKYKRLVGAISQDIESGSLAAGARLPTQRETAADLGISVQTVTNAYKELERQGLIRCEVGRGSFVAPRVTVSNYVLDTADREVVDFSTAHIVHCAEHDAAWREVCGVLSRVDDQPWIRSYRPIAGADHHRQAGAQWLATLNMPTNPESLIVTNGATQAIFLALASTVGPGDTVLSENVTDHGVIGLSNLLGFTLKGLETDEYGIRPEHFEEVCASERVTAIVCTPTFNNPTVSLMPYLRRASIARIAAKHGVFVIEDDAYGALFEASSTPITSLVPDLGFYCTSLAKSVMSGLRVGYLVTPRRYALRVESVLRVSTWMTAPPVAEVATRWINDGTAKRLVDLQRQKLATRQGMLRAALGSFVKGAHPNALSAWLAVPEHWHADRIVRELRNRHIAVTSPEPFLVPGTPCPNAIRICVGADVTDATCEAAFRTIAETFEQYPQVHDF